jgi:hypothetical protein
MANSDYEFMKNSAEEGELCERGAETLRHIAAFYGQIQASGIARLVDLLYLCISLYVHYAST